MSWDMRNAEHLWLAVRDALLNRWDPIGVRDAPQARDEYDSYVSPIFCMLIEEPSAEKIFNYLWYVQTELMGLSEDRAHSEAVSQFLITLPHTVAARVANNGDDAMDDFRRIEQRSPWHVIWAADDGSQGANFCESFEEAELVRGLLLRELSMDAVRRLPERYTKDGARIAFTFMRPMNANVTSASIEYNGEPC